MHRCFRLQTTEGVFFESVFDAAVNRWVWLKGHQSDVGVSLSPYLNRFELWVRDNK